jgi:hypothetical protein
LLPGQFALERRGEWLVEEIMAQEDDDADKLPPLGDDTAKYLEDAKKGKPRSFLLVCNGAKIRYLVLALSWSRVLFHRETKPGRRRSGPGPENQIPIPLKRLDLGRLRVVAVRTGQVEHQQLEVVEGLHTFVYGEVKDVIEATDADYETKLVASFGKNVIEHERADDKTLLDKDMLIWFELLRDPRWPGDEKNPKACGSFRSIRSDQGCVPPRSPVFSLFSLGLTRGVFSAVIHRRTPDHSPPTPRLSLSGRTS